MNNQKIQYLVSTDSIGAFGFPEQFVYLWKEFLQNKTISGVEAVAFKPLLRLRKLVNTLEANKISVVSFHGKTGGEDRLDLLSRIIMTSVNAFILPAETLLHEFPGVELLSHAPNFEDESVKKAVLKYKPKKIWIENHLFGKRGITEAMEQIKTYRESEINARGMLDIYHFVAKLPVKHVLRNWRKIIDQIAPYFREMDKEGSPLFTGVHFPIGTRANDSLPVDYLKDEDLKYFAKKIVPSLDRIVFENQQKVPGLFFSTQKMLEKQKARNKNLINRFKKTGIII